MTKYLLTALVFAIAIKSSLANEKSSTYDIRSGKITNIKLVAKEFADRKKANSNKTTILQNYQFDKESNTLAVLTTSWKIIGEVSIKGNNYPVISSNADREVVELRPENEFLSAKLQGNIKFRILLKPLLQTEFSDKQVSSIIVKQHFELVDHNLTVTSAITTITGWVHLKNENSAKRNDLSGDNVIDSNWVPILFQDIMIQRVRLAKN